MKFGWKGALGIAISAACLYFAFHGIDWADARRTTARTRTTGCSLLAAVAATLMFPLRARRWRTILDPVAPKLPFGAAVAVDRDRHDGQQHRAAARRRARSRLRALARRSRRSPSRRRSRRSSWIACSTRSSCCCCSPSRCSRPTFPAAPRSSVSPMSQLVARSPSSPVGAAHRALRARVLSRRAHSTVRDRSRARVSPSSSRSAAARCCGASPTD